MVTGPTEARKVYSISKPKAANQAHDNPKPKHKCSRQKSVATEHILNAGNIRIQSFACGIDDSSGLETECVLARVSDIKETILVLVLFVNAAHEGRGRGKDLLNEDENGLLGCELNALADNVDELADGKIGWDKILLLVDRRDVALLNLLADDRNAISVLLADALGLCLPLLEGVLVLELAAHDDGVGSRVSWMRGCDKIAKTGRDAV
jgi:hypothetical protein